MRHALIGMLSAVLVLGFLAPARAAETHVVTITEDAFTPASLNVQKGDVVRWEWQSGGHTIASGSPDDEDTGSQFEFIINADVPFFEYTFTETGTFAYFSRVRSELTGSITVLNATPVDVRTWGFIKRMFETSQAGRRAS